MAPPFGKLSVPVSLFLGVAIIGGSVIWGFRDTGSLPFLTAQIGSEEASIGVDSGGTTGGGSSSSAAPVCGNSTREGSEGCDDGNTTAGDGCSATCTVESGYTCVNSNPDLCTTSCGDGIVAGTEQCESPFGTCCNSLTCLFKSSSTECRASAGDCDVAENCTGSAATCPSDSVRASGYQCAALDSPTPAAPTPYTHEGTHRRDCNGSDVTCPAAANIAPAVGTIADQSTTVNNAVSVSFLASDADSDTLYFSASGLPTGVTLTTDTATSGHMSGAPVQVGSYTVTVTAADGFGGQATRTFTWNVSPSFVVTLSSSAASSSAVSSVASSAASSASSQVASSASSGGLCGNGALNAGEQCDDGNTTDGDGCDRFCNVESGWTCDGDIACSAGASCLGTGAPGTGGKQCPAAMPQPCPNGGPPSGTGELCRGNGCPGACHACTTSSSGTSSAGSASSGGCNIPKILFYNLQSGYSAYNAEGATLQNAGWDVTIDTRASHPVIDLPYLQNYDIAWFYNGCNGTVGMPTAAEIAAIGDYYIAGGDLVFGTDAANGDAYQGPGTCFARVNAITQTNLGVLFSGSLDRHASQCWSVVGSHPLFYNGGNIVAAHSDAIISLTNNVQWGTTQPSIPGTLLDGNPALAFTPAESGHGQAMFLPNETTILASCPASLTVFENYAGLAGFQKSCPAGGSSSSGGGSIFSALWSRLMGLFGLNAAPQTLVAQVGGGGSMSCPLINFDVLPDGSTVNGTTPHPNQLPGTDIDNQYQTYGALFSTTAPDTLRAVFCDTATCIATASPPNLLEAANGTINGGLIHPVVITVVDRQTGQPSTATRVRVTLVSVGADPVRGTSYDANGAILQTVDVVNPGTGVGAGEMDPVDFTTPGIAQVVFSHTSTSPFDAFAIDDVIVDASFCGGSSSAGSASSGGYCTTICGDGIKVGGEQCDNGSQNGTPGNSCSANCTNAGSSSAGSQSSSSGGSNSSGGSSSSAGLCGNGVRQGTEQCDDGNTRDGDGCDRFCMIEDKWQCFAGSGACPQPLDCSKDTAGGSCTDHSFNCPSGKTLYDAGIGCGTDTCAGTCKVCTASTNPPPSGSSAGGTSSTGGGISSSGGTSSGGAVGGGVSCSETDGGLNVYTAGSITTNTGVRADTCGSPVVLEECFCGSPLNPTCAVFTCPGGGTCSNGKCSGGAGWNGSLTCFDADGTNVLTATLATVYNLEGVRVAQSMDDCQSDTSVKERVCAADGTSIMTSVLPCPQGRFCVNGFCS